MKKIFCPDAAIVENVDTTVSQICTIYTNDDSVVTLIAPKPYPKIGETITKDSYYFKDGDLVKVTTTGLVTDTMVLTKIATISVKPAEITPVEITK